eukprot:CAMPEP_0173395488 /NCGR_PEP_ID=MMETSP1356-20130122/32216_1 /TAXON_ID=77927 ORGANISM="Hemiselmis virescens, Strain PCC157" /NCGR_SAMPLE_ID=MMETSP1356 /ASSEMBLY_ACC=CAM_ASM_000847 /LENGTH=472 /DNA_ID=CAMNT_0014354233 /DNA_START=1 /DNA_END=1416 /DNA_ORIENTATION=+
MEVAEVASQLLQAAMTPLHHSHNGTRPGGEPPNIPFGTVEFWIVFTCCMCLVGFAALMSGLTMAYMSIEPLNLSLLQASGTVQEKTYASAIAPLLANRHFLLVTLLVGNASAMEALPIFLDKLVPTYVAVILSVTLVLIFGEIIPQAVFTKYRLPIGAHLALYIQIQEFLTSPLCWPIAVILDMLLGKGHPTIYRRSELKELTKMHVMDPSGQGTLSAEEVRLMVGTMELAEKQVKDAMQPISDVFMLSMDQCLDSELISDIYGRGHSRIPVYENHPSHFVGFVLVKNLILVSAEDKVALREVASLCMKPMTRVGDSTSLFELMRHFKQIKTPIALAVDDDVPEGVPLNDKKVVGLITMEDVLEELLQEEIEDETDGEGVSHIMQGIAQKYFLNKSHDAASRNMRRWGGGKQSPAKPSPAKPPSKAYSQSPARASSKAPAEGYGKAAVDGGGRQSYGKGAGYGKSPGGGVGR